MTETVSTDTVPLRRWIWRSYVKAALVPLVVIELALIGLYMGTNYMTREQSTDRLRQIADKELSRIADQTALNVELQLDSVSSVADLWRRRVGVALDTPHDPGATERARYQRHPSGAVYTFKDNGGAASFYSSRTHFGDGQRRKMLQLAQLDDLMQDVLQSQRLASQVYFNSHDSLNRIYPYIDTLDTYPHDLNLPSYNFYYEADASHNPQRRVVWTDVYIDPAGQGWMTSAIAPVYRGNFLEGVAGIDVLVKDAVAMVESLRIPWQGYALLVSKTGTIMALPGIAEADWGLRELTQHSYSDAIRQDVFKPDQFNINKRSDSAALAAAMSGRDRGLRRLEIGTSQKIVSWATIPSTGWKLLVLVPEKFVYAEAEQWAERFSRIGMIVIGAMILFYVGFFLVLARRAQVMSQRVAEPLAVLEKMASRIGDGHYDQVPPTFRISELCQTGQHLAAMGQRLGETTQEVIAAKDDLQQQSEFLTALIETLPMPVFQLDGSGRIAVCNSAFRRFFGQSGQALVGTRLSSHLPAEVLKPDPMGVRELTLPNIKGEVRDVELLLAEPDIGLRGTIGVMVDVTDRKLGEVAMRGARDRAMEASRLKTRFLTAISHEFLTPVHGVRDHATKLAESELTEDQRQDLALLQKSTDRLWDLISDLLDYTQLQSGTLRPAASSISVSSLIDAITEPMKLQAEEKGLIFKRVVKVGSLTNLVTDQEMVERAMHRLSDNAIKFTDQGCITLEATLIEESANRGASWLELAVRDDGPGIEAVERDHIFDPFTQTEYAQKKDHQGSGIGLSLARGLTTLLAGQIGLDDTPPPGARFWLRLPVRTAPYER